MTESSHHSSTESSSASVESPGKASESSRAGRLENRFEYLFFSTRWLIAPIYAGLAGGLLVVLVKFVQMLVHLLVHCWRMSFDDMSIATLDLIDMALLANLLLIVMFAGYENYVSRLDLKDNEDYPAWMGQVTFGDIKVKLMASIVAMSAIHLLADFLRVDTMTNRELGWSVGIHMAFVISGVLIAIMDRLTEHKEEKEASSERKKH
ncbi:TIGR00645 family protein [Saccharibacter sp. 17.LH.SD]|uniref:TIGR00645 family protein n=1 Tax=Saccharibacter sp. 17.LH.SD TaxID=2689393 RepID=UPI00136CEB27|nr:TIGR00645 family protein [Saccharibacter sp. 17.LH.SD]MXV43879.1 TIGR00645 family protein [Saccharibacter sp. 17.LH.SD]